MGIPGNFRGITENSLKIPGISGESWKIANSCKNPPLISADLGPTRGGFLQRTGVYSITANPAKPQKSTKSIKFIKCIESTKSIKSMESIKSRESRKSTESTNHNNFE